MWSPKRNRNGSNNNFYNNMTRVDVGDVVVSFAASLIQAVGIVTRSAYTAPKPQEFGVAGDVWSNDGWKIEVDYFFPRFRIRPSEHMETLAPLLPERYSPLQTNGRGNQAYLFELSEQLFDALAELVGVAFVKAVMAESEDKIIDSDETRIETSILSDSSLNETTKDQLVKARKGQGIFKGRLARVESCCRVTGLAVRRHLIASHIKPWRDASHEERLDGNNGLMLAPHIDHLFDKGYISFSDVGEVLLSAHLKSDVLNKWGVSKHNVGSFNTEQKSYLEYHRKHIFKR